MMYSRSMKRGMPGALVIAAVVAISAGFHFQSTPVARIAAASEDPLPPNEMDEPLPDDPLPSESGLAPEPRKLTDQEINRLRFMELRAMRGLRGVDRVTVKVPSDTVDEFLLEMTGHRDFRGDQARKNFLRQTPPQKLHTIAHYRGAEFADKVRILTDPEIFLEFRRHVMPQVIRGCATSGCHVSTNGSAYGFKLFHDPKRTPGTTYANFLILNEFMMDGRRMIDRNDPEKSLLATMMLPDSQVQSEFRHPGDEDIRPLFQSPRHPRYRRILDWIGSLKIPQEDYGVHLLPPRLREPTTQPADDVDDAQNMNDNGG